MARAVRADKCTAWPIPKTPDDDLAHAGRRAPQPLEPRTGELFASHREDPFARFAALLELARENQNHREPTAMALSTVDASGRPSSRIVLLKAADARGLTFFTNLESRKGREIAANPAVALLFHWQPLEVQVRVEGEAVRVADAGKADAYFATRPRQSQLGAWASEQSAPLESREALLARMEAADRALRERTGAATAALVGLSRRDPLAIEF